MISSGSNGALIVLAVFTINHVGSCSNDAGGGTIFIFERRL
jgi:hypothetical protein